MQAMVHTLKVTLTGVRPIVWRRLEVPSAATLGELSDVLRQAFDWSDMHLHEFVVRGNRYGVPDPADSLWPFDRGLRDEDTVQLRAVAPRAGERFDYTFDFGDNWEHRILVEKVQPAHPDSWYPACTAGSGLPPEEDTGRLRPGRFDDTARARLNASMQRSCGGSPGRDLPAPERGDEVFDGLLPALLDDGAGECPCGCGGPSEPFGGGPLPVEYPVPAESLAVLAAESALVRRAVALARWVGTSRPLTAGGLLRPADARQAVLDLDLFEVVLPSSTPPGPPGEAARPGPRLDGEGEGDGCPDADPPPRRRSRPGGPDQWNQIGAPGRSPARPSDRSPARPPERRGAALSTLPADGELDLGLHLARPSAPWAEFRVRSAKDVPVLHQLWTAAVGAGLVDVRGTKASAGPGLALWDDPPGGAGGAGAGADAGAGAGAGADAAARVDGWCRLLAGYVRGGAEAGASGPWFAVATMDDVLSASVPLIYALTAREPMPVGFLALALADLGDDDETSLLPPWVLPGLRSAAEAAAEVWAAAGVIGVRAPSSLPPDPAAGPLTGPDRFGEMLADLRDRLLASIAVGGPEGSGRAVPGGVAARRDLQRSLDSLAAGPPVMLTPLGSYALARILRAHGWVVPSAGECVDLGPAELLDRLLPYLPEDAVVEAGLWIGARDDRWEPAVREAALAAAVQGPEGPGRRAALPAVLCAVGPRVTPLLDEWRDDPWLGAVAALARDMLGLGPPPSLAQRIWLAVDAVSAAADSPEEFEELVDATQLVDLLATPGGVAAAVAVRHPQAAGVLRRLSPLVDDPLVARSLRKALAPGAARPGLRVVGGSTDRGGPRGGTGSPGHGPRGGGPRGGGPRGGRH